MKLFRSASVAFVLPLIVAFTPAFASEASATVSCSPDPIIYAQSPFGIEKFNVVTKDLTVITASPGRVYFDIGIAPDGTLYGVDGGGGNLYSIDKVTGVGTLIGEILLPAGSNLNMLAFDQFGKGWFVGATTHPDITQLMSFDPTAVVGGNITPTTVIADLQTLGVPIGSSSGDVFFVGGNMYIAWDSYEDAPRDGVRLIRVDLNNTGTAYTSKGTAADLGKINAVNVYGMAVHDGVIYVANNNKISRLNSLPTTADVNRLIPVTDIITTTTGTIYGMTAEGEANIDNCLEIATFGCSPDPIIYAQSPFGIEKFNVVTKDLTVITASPGRVYFDIGIAPDGTLYGVDGGGGNLYSIDKVTGVGTLIGEILLPAGSNLNMLAFDQFGKGWFVGATTHPDITQLMSFDPTAVVGGNITPTTVIADLQTLGVPIGSSSGDVFFVGGNMYIAWDSYEDAPRDGVRLIRVDLNNTGTAYTSKGTAADLGKINAVNVYGMAVHDGVIYVANNNKISRLNSLPTTADVNRLIPVTDIITTTTGTIYGMTAEGEANIDNCLTVQSFVAPPEPIVTSSNEPNQPNQLIPVVSDPQQRVKPKQVKRLPSTGQDSSIPLTSLLLVGLGLTLIGGSKSLRKRPTSNGLEFGGR